MLTPSEPQERGSDARRIKEALAAMGAEGLCAELGLCDGAPRPSRGSWWRTPRGVCVCCPVHNDTRPSCNVDHDGTKLVWLCRSCKASGSALDLVAAVVHIDAKTAFRELLDAAARVAGVADTRGTYTPRSSPPRPARPAPAPRVALDLDTFARVADVILTDPLTALDRHPEPPDEREGCACGCVDVRRYLEDRGLLDLALRDGWRSLPTHPSERAQLARNVVVKVGREAWEASGLVLSWHDRETGERKVLASEFRRPHHRVVIPWRDRTGRVTQLQRRFLLVAPFAPQCPACDRGARCAAYPHRRFITSVEDERIPEADRRLVGGGKYDSAGEAVDPYGAHRLAVEPDAPVAFTEGALDALAWEARKGCDAGYVLDALRAGEDLRALAILDTPDPHAALAQLAARERARLRDALARVIENGWPNVPKAPRWIGLGLPGVNRWSAEWADLARGRDCVVGLDADAKPKTREVVDGQRRMMRGDLESVARSVRVMLPHLDGCEAEKVDWCDVWRAARA